MSKKKVITIIGLIFSLSLIHFMAVRLVQQKWRESTAGAITASHESVYLPKGKYIVFLRGKDESKVKLFMRFLPSEIRFVSAEDEKTILKTNSQYKGSRAGFYEESIGIIKIEQPGTYSLPDINIPEDMELIIIHSSYDSYFIWTFVILGFFYIPITLYVIWAMKDWYIFRWFVKSVFGISIGKEKIV